ncbi:hypothetical protein L0337_30105 [candidate division KSB1 bacterium]|nr:hypothetical protein [candidate division KSB1 bacterium]
MKLFNRTFGEYLQFAKVGVYLLALVSLVRFLMKPVFNIPFAEGTHFTSVTILLPILMIVYALRAGSAGFGSYRDLLGIAAALAIPTTAFIVLGIAVDSLAGIETYYTDPDHGGNINQWLHVGGHLLVTGVVYSLILWGLGSLVHLATGASRKKAMA